MRMIHKYFRIILDHKITNDSLLETLYRPLDDNNKAVTETITGGSFTNCTFRKAAQRLEKVTKTNRVWGIRDTEMTRRSFSISTNLEQAKINHDVLQELAPISTIIGLLIKQNQERVNAVSQ